MPKIQNVTLSLTSVILSTVAVCSPVSASAKALGDPITVGDGLTLDPIVDARVRLEVVNTPTTDADALTVRIRPGFELKHAPSGLSFLADVEGTFALSDDYNAFPFALASSQRRTSFATVPDAESFDLNRFQVQYRTKKFGLTLGRQRINLDDQRFVGSVGWRQNEQTFDAVRAEATLGPISLDATYSIKQHTIFGSEAGPRRSYDGDFLFLGASGKAGPIAIKAFSYILDYDEAVFFSNSSKTIGARASGTIPLSKAAKINLLGSYARQTDFGTNPVNYAADYILGEAALAVKGYTVTAGYELLGGDPDVSRSFQTPLATLHKFNGWADLFLTTPGAGLQDVYITLAKAFPKVKALPGLNANVTYHRFSSDIGSTRYGNELDASIGFKVGKMAILAKYADYSAKGFGADKSIFWLQADIAF